MPMPKHTYRPAAALQHSFNTWTQKEKSILSKALKRAVNRGDKAIAVKSVAAQLGRSIQGVQKMAEKLQKIKVAK